MSSMCKSFSNKKYKETKLLKNSLAIIQPDFLDEWDYDNNVLTPQEVSARNNVSTAWVCSVCGHRWKTLVSARNRGTGCPQCQKNFHTSFPEYIIYFYLKKVFTDTVNGYKFTEKRKSKVIDIFIPSLNLAIEYDGGRWHKNIQTDMAKTQWLLEQEISLIRLRETTCPPLFDNSVQIPVEYNSSDYRYLEAGISILFDYIKETYDIAFSIIVDIESDFSVILDSYETNKKEKALSIVNPELAEEWDYIKNSPLTPDKIIATSDKKCWWVCKKCGYSWKAVVNDRNSGHGCPYCAGHALWSGKNDLMTKRPLLVSEWDYEKNGNLRPENIAYRSGHKAWWKCKKCSHSWSARIADRSNGIGCPACTGKVVKVGILDLATVNHKLASQWDYEKNGDLTPQMVTGGSNKKVWWKCDVCSHSWESYIYSRHLNGRGCPKCGQKRKHRKKVEKKNSSV